MSDHNPVFPRSAPTQTTSKGSTCSRDLGSFHLPLSLVKQLLLYPPPSKSLPLHTYTSSRLLRSFSPNLQQYKAAVNSLLNDNRKLVQSTISPFKRYITNAAQFYIKREARNCITCYDINIRVLAFTESHSFAVPLKRLSELFLHRC